MKFFIVRLENHYTFAHLSTAFLLISTFRSSAGFLTPSWQHFCLRHCLTTVLELEVFASTCRGFLSRKLSRKLPSFHNGRFFFLDAPQFSHRLIMVHWLKLDAGFATKTEWTDLKWMELWGLILRNTVISGEKPPRTLPGCSSTEQPSKPVPHHSRKKTLNPTNFI